MESPSWTLIVYTMESDPTWECPTCCLIIDKKLGHCPVCECVQTSIFATTSRSTFKESEPRRSLIEPPKPPTKAKSACCVLQ